MSSLLVAVRRRFCVAAALVALAVSGCAAGPPTASAPVPPPVGGGLDYQLGGAYDPPTGVDVVVRDSTDEPAAGVYSVCYLNGFQTQPADSERMLADSPELILTAGGGPVRDENWSDELLFDTGSAGKRTALAALLLPQVTACAAAGFDAVELDNLDSYTRSAGLLTAEDNVAFARILVTGAHGEGLAIGQKNAADLAGPLSELFDFAVAEECDRWQECGLYRAAYGDRVLAIEYADDLREDFAAACAVPGRPRSMILRDRDLTVAGAVGYVYERC
ncbi:endo alpha-1,4 polygalactosaminidase [Cryobacterium sp. N22]|uniref:endo alpha-1,4 polygalactosaminidase n=1 Tax=Cryobacterium sp. N22 TaxID=2048290 RepID=UPI000CE2C233|nr:endo alpha-1,4 polygalactosaminidase [Cryobacterium sp. N22]